MASLDGILDRALVQLDLDHVAARRFHGLLDSDGDFPRFATPESHPALAIADHGQGGKTEDTATLDHLRHAVDLDQLLLQVAVLLVLLLLVKRHCLPAFSFCLP